MQAMNASVIGTGLLDLRFSLSMSVGVVSLALVGCALSAAAWQLKDLRAERQPIVFR